MNFITPKNIPKFIIILPIFGIIISTILITSITLYTLQNNFQKEKEKVTNTFMTNLKQTTKQRVELTYNIVDALYKANNKNKNQTIKVMQEVLDKMRWNKKGYIFVFDYYGNTIYHPNKQFMKINRWNFERDGVKVIRLIIENALKSPKGAYVKYLAYNPNGSPLSKVSYVKIYKPLKIVIGNGVYLNYLDKKLLSKQKIQQNIFDSIIKNIIIVTIIVSIFMIFIMYLFSSIVSNLFKNYNSRLLEEKQHLFVRANFDTLTGAYNINHFLSELRELIIANKEEDKKLAILFIDLDYFKDINDSLGHQFGDKVLKIVTKRLKYCIKDIDIIARFGGDEFIVLLTNPKSLNEVSDIAQKILDKLKEVFILNGKEHSLSASIGISVYPDDAIEQNKLIRYADTAMYKAKKAGKDRFAFYTHNMSEEIKHRVEIKNSLYKALSNQEFVLNYQAQIDKNNNLYAIEALIRWNNPQKGLVLPEYFIPLAIELGIIDKIDLWVIENSIIQYKKWENKGLNPGILSCNITIYQLEKSSFEKDLKIILDKYKFDPKKLNLEISEKDIMKNPQKSILMLNYIRCLNIDITIDNFATGYSSLSYLQKLPVAKLKIDRSFVKDIPKNKGDEVIVKMVIDLAKELNLKVIAEGVETQIQKDFVLKNNCDYLQGYYFAQPLDEQRFENKFLKETDVSE